MKKLLILGGNALSCDIVTTARSMGIYTIVTDWNDVDKSPAKAIADEAWDVSLTDYDELEHRVKENHIDGIFTNYTDSYLIPYAILCKRCSLPCLASEKQIETISNKNLSKDLCIRHNIPVSKAFEISGEEDLNKLLPEIKFPVITKPVDQSGQRGIFVCNDVEDLKKYYSESRKYSKADTLLIEEYLQGDYVVMFYTVQNGVVSLASMADKPVAPMLDKNQVRLPLAYILPSKYVDLCKSTVLPGVQNFVTSMGLQNGVIGIEGIVTEGAIHVFEMQFRLGGMRHHEFVLQENGMNLMEMLIRFAVSGKFEGWNAAETDNANFKHTYVLYNVLINVGKVGSVKGVDKVKALPYVTKITQMCGVGDEILLPSTVQQIFCKVSIELPDDKTIHEIIAEIDSLLEVKDSNGQNMLTDYWKSIL